MGASCFLLFPSLACCLSSTNSIHVCMSVYACVRVFRYVCMCERDSLLHMLCWHLWWGGVCVNDATIAPHLRPSSPSSSKTLVLSASALRSRCGISQRTRLQPDQLFKLQVSASGEKSSSCVYCLFFFFFLHILSLHTKWLIMP